MDDRAETIEERDWGFRAPQRSLAADDRGAVMVIAVFMTAVIVGVAWFMFGLGEAMLYRQHLRAAVDATAFDAAVVHALGMNMLSMMNIAMAAVLSILVALMIVFIGGLVATVIAIVLLLVPGVDIVDAGALAELIDFDSEMYDTISEIQPEIFETLTVLNVSEGVVAIAMPWAAFVASKGVAGEYAGNVTDTSSFSPSMIPTRLPYVMNSWQASNKIGFGKFSKNMPTVPFTGKKAAPLKTPLFTRYGLPVQDDTFGMLCMHAGTELVQEAALIPQVLSFGLLPAPPAKVTDVLGGVLGEVTGSMPWLFCSGVDPIQALSNVLTSVDPFAQSMLGTALKQIPIISTVVDGEQKAKDMLKTKYPSMFPMKPYDDAKNGNSYMQVWASSTGSATMTTGAVQGVAIAGFGRATPAPNADADMNDFAEAEFYYDCGNPATSADEMIMGTDDTSGDWQDCKYNATWNMQWKARLRRYHQFEEDIRKDILLSLYQGTGLDDVIKGLVLPGFQDGSLAKTGVLDPIKSCITSIGSGSDSGTGDFGGCPLGIGQLFSVPNGGKIGIGPDNKYGYSMSDILH